MPSTHSQHDPIFARIVERQMRNWELTRSQRSASTVRKTKSLELVCISRQIGLGNASRIELLLGERFDWPVYGKELLAIMAQGDETRQLIYASVDQRDVGWLEQTVRPLMQLEFGRHDYFHRLCATVVDLHRTNPGIFVGRGVDLILPRDRGLRVRLVGSRDTRIDNLVAKRGTDRKEAEGYLTKSEAAQQQFFRSYFGAAAGTDDRFDLIVNTDRFTAEDVVAVIYRAYKLRRKMLIPGETAQASSSVVVK